MIWLVIGIIVVALLALIALAWLLLVLLLEVREREADRGIAITDDAGATWTVLAVHT
ncbi:MULTISPECIES: hypothetical protein [unclassified Cryobacterium]|uniref:hypothetical protein n=1 Tax=unclassified Cryobacterium TaxID=2649013 RepID=UPI001304A066|nr:MULTISPECIES: hypothetical protein [unclassified Cryobacterium]